MAGYTARRLLLLFPVVFAITIIVFLMVEAIPGDPAQRIAGIDATPEDIQNLRVKMGLDRSPFVRYGEFLWNAAQGDLGESLTMGIPVSELIPSRVLATAQLAFLALAIAIVVGVALGVASALTHGTVWDNLATAISIVGISMPIFWLGLLLMWFFAVQLGWLPTSGKGGISHLVLPSVTLAGVSIPMVARMTRSSMLEVLRQDYIRTAQAKGLRYFTVVNRHALRNALIPVVTIIGLQFGYLLGGSIITETVFAWPGMGRLAVEAIRDNDFAVVQAAVMIIAVSFVVVNLIVDLLYSYIDPRVRYE